MSDSVRPHRRQPTRLPHPWDSPGKNTGVGCHFLLQCMKVKSETEVAQSCPTLLDPMDCSLPGSSACGIFQARVLEWGAIAFSGLNRQLSLKKLLMCLFLAVLGLCCFKGFSLVVVSRDYSSLKCVGFSLWWLPLLQSMGSRAQASVVVVPGLQSTGLIAVMQGLSCSAASGIFPDQGLNPCLLHWQADSLPLSHPHQGSPGNCLLKRFEYAKSYIFIYVVTCSVFIIPLCRS